MKLIAVLIRIAHRSNSDIFIREYVKNVAAVKWNPFLRGI